MTRGEIRIRGEVLREIRNLGDLNSTEEQVIKDLILHAKSCDHFWENRFD